MGGGFYSYSDRSTRAMSLGYTTATHKEEVFVQRKMVKDMDPKGITFRECRDSDDHPLAIPVVLALDVTGSMGGIPFYLVKDGLPHFMQLLYDRGIKDAQVLFCGVGDHECDSAPFQVGQFESSDEALDKWLTSLWLESGGGGNAGESYMLAWYFAAFHTVCDHIQKGRGKGILITIGDEPVLGDISHDSLRKIFGSVGIEKSADSDMLLAAASEHYNCYHIHVKETQQGSRKKTQDGWKQLLGDRCIFVDTKEEVSQAIAYAIALEVGDTAVAIAQAPKAEVLL